MQNIGIIGASGYAGMEASHLLARHPRVRLALLGSASWEGRSAAETLGLEGEAGTLVYLGPSTWEPALDDCDAVLLATPEEASRALVPSLLDRGLKIIDLSSAFRTGEAGVYGLPERYRTSIPGAALVANPGCYPTAIILALAPLLEARLLESEGLVIHALSGATGAGRRADEGFGFSDLADDVRAYGIFDHRHLPELRRILGEAAGEEVDPIFTPTLLPIRRGILVTAVGRLAPGADEEAIGAVYREAYASEAFISLAGAPGEVRLSQVVGTNLCRIGFAVQGERFLVCAAIDNLVKGAAGQAIQNLNLLFGWEENLGLRGLRRLRP